MSRRYPFARREVNGAAVALLLILSLCFCVRAQAAWTHVNSEGATEKTGDTSIVLNPATNPAAESIVLVGCSTDNPNNVGPAETTHHTVSDDQSNSWTKVVEYQPMQA